MITKAMDNIFKGMQEINSGKAIIEYCSEDKSIQGKAYFVIEKELMPVLDKAIEDYDK